jgi:hypothetical protein
MSLDVMYRVRTVLQGWQGAPGLSTCYFGAPGGANGTDALAAANRVRGSWDVVKTIMGSGLTMQVLGQVDIIDPVAGALQGSLAVTQPAVVTGTCGTGAGPAALAGGLQLHTADVVRGRRVIGRLFIGPLCATNTGNVVPPAGVGTAIAAMGVALVTVSPPATPPLRVWSRPVFDKVTHALIHGGANFDVLTSSAATKYFTIRSRRD